MSPADIVRKLSKILKPPWKIAEDLNQDGVEG